MKTELHLLIVVTAGLLFYAGKLSAQTPVTEKLKPPAIIHSADSGCISLQYVREMNPDTAINLRIDVLKRAAIDATPFVEEYELPHNPQIDILMRAAIDATPFIAECEKNKDEKKAIVRMYWVDDHNELRELSKVPIKAEVSYCVETVGIEAGEVIKLDLKDNDGRTYKNGEKTITLRGYVELDGTAYFDRIKLEYQETDKKNVQADEKN
ncbi:MAG: hypothetical protein LBT24_02290 [Tannerella sp.]|jgi:hypothetical protein|nr:hypothetical protein [Tannerella sp.]